jgi:hypothetical protein
MLGVTPRPEEPAVETATAAVDRGAVVGAGEGELTSRSILSMSFVSHSLREL